ncbi:MAG: NAD(P)(+) transhydrogenase (Re/Si-specific) subunit beta [Candidatus Hydrogenedentes bacterium]|nr:NAD(P)(+) transhydrogenase (Re/Si-specific) subunit beta [Candidatus Hydrogenedentota bacterium]
MSEHTIHFIYLASTACFILSLKWLGAVPTARRGVITGALGMALAVGGTLLEPTIENYRFIAGAIVVGTIIGVPMAMMPMTAVPQRTALSHAFGALAAALVGTAEYFLHWEAIDRFTMGALAIEVILGSLTVTASLMAAGKLQEVIPTRAILFRGQNYVNLAVLGGAVLIGAYLVVDPTARYLFPIMVALCLAFGVMLIVPIGGADMPTVIALLNSYAGLAASMMGFVLDNKLLIVAGALDGSSGLILSIVMCKAMNRSMANVLFGGFGATAGAQASGVKGEARSLTPADAAYVLEAARSVVFIPGYGMAVAQAQHVVHELAESLEKNGAEVRYAIHPVAGRMPGHMNVLLAEADVPYEQLVEMEDINPLMETVDVAIVIGANDVVNPAARSDESSPIYGMPIIDADKARTVFVLKRSMASGFAGVDNPLFFNENTRMIFGDAKKTMQALVTEFKIG